VSVVAYSRVRTLDGGSTMANKDKGGKPAKKQAAHSLKEKRQAKKDKRSK